MIHNRRTLNDQYKDLELSMNDPYCLLNYPSIAYSNIKEVKRQAKQAWLYTLWNIMTRKGLRHIA